MGSARDTKWPALPTTKFDPWPSAFLYSAVHPLIHNGSMMEARSSSNRLSGLRWVRRINRGYCHEIVDPVEAVRIVLVDTSGMVNLLSMRRSVYVVTLEREKAGNGRYKRVLVDR